MKRGNRIITLIMGTAILSFSIPAFAADETTDAVQEVEKLKQEMVIAESGSEETPNTEVYKMDEAKPEAATDEAKKDCDTKENDKDVDTQEMPKEGETEAK